MINDLILKNRSYQRFHQNVPVSQDILKYLIDPARHLAFLEINMPNTEETFYYFLMAEDIQN